MKAILVVLVVQFIDGQAHLQSPVIMNYASMDICQNSKTDVLDALKDAISGPLSELPQDIKTSVYSRCRAMSDGQW